MEKIINLCIEVVRRYQNGEDWVQYLDSLKERKEVRENLERMFGGEENGDKRISKRSL